MFLLSRIVFWETCTSPHKNALFNALCEIAPDIEIICSADRNYSVEREAQGWSFDSKNRFNVVVSPEQKAVDKLVSDKLDSTLHIFSGIRWVPTIVKGLKAVRRKKAKFAIMSEPRVNEGWRGTLRYMQSWLTEGWLRNNAEFILAIGKNGPAWFEGVGYPKDRIFPFAYFIEPPISGILENELNNPIERPIRIVYVGRLIKMKGIFDLVYAVSQLKFTAKLTIIGTGVEENALRLLCRNLKVDADFLGVIPNKKIGVLISQMDILVLASTSKDDGWGVVISEALMVGTAVIATPCVGASIILDNNLFGQCVPAESPKSLMTAIQDLKSSGAFSNVTRFRRQEGAIKKLSANAGANYLLSIIDYRLGNGERPPYFFGT